MYIFLHSFPSTNTSLKRPRHSTEILAISGLQSARFLSLEISSGKKKILLYISNFEYNSDHLISLYLLTLLLVGLASSAFLWFNRKMTRFILYSFVN